MTGDDHGAGFDSAQPDSLTDDDLRDLWARYTADRDDTFARDRLTEHYLPIPRKIAGKLAKNYPACVDTDELYAAGCFGLLEALAAYDQDRGVKFETFCSRRIQGAMIDMLRKDDIVPRPDRRDQGRRSRAVQELQAQLGRQPTDLELMDYLELDVDEFQLFDRRSHTATMTSLTPGTDDDDDGHGPRSERLINDRAADPLTEMELAEAQTAILDKLAPRERMTFVLRHFEKMNMKVIGEVMGVTESRISQVNTALKKRVLSWFDDAA
jgi:RNA polymerase sigma factor for flagellar operon FliA